MQKSISFQVMTKFLSMLIFMMASTIAIAPLANAQSVIKIAALMELTGVGASAGTQFNQGLQLAVKEINADGGILGRKIVVTTSDTTTQPSVAVELTKKAIDQDVFAIFGPVFSGSINASMKESQKAGIPNWTGGEAANITLQGNPYVFRTSFTQATAMPKVAIYMAQKAKIKTLAIMYVNNDFGRGGLEMLKQALAGTETKIVEEIATEGGQADFFAPVSRLKQSNAQAVFIYLNEDESARALKELRKQAWNKPMIGETTLTGQKVLDLAGEAADGAIGHVGLTIEAPVSTIQAFKVKFEKEYQHLPDHNGMKGYSGVYVMKAAIEKAGKFDRAAVAAAMKGLKVNVGRYPGALLYTEFDNKGDLDRMSFLVQVKNGKAQVIDLLPPLKSRVTTSYVEPIKSNKKPPQKVIKPAP